MANYLQLSNTTEGITKRLLVYSLDYSWNNLVSDYPIPGKFGILENQHQGWTNPSMSLDFTIPVSTTDSSLLTWTDWNRLARSTSETIMTVNIGSSNVMFSSFASSSSGVSSIPIAIKSFRIRISPKDNNTNYYTVNATLVEDV